MKPRVLTIADNGYWAIGTTGKLIVRNFSDDFDFLFIPEAVLERRADILREMLLTCDVIFCMNESSAMMLRERATVPLPPVVTWIHHVTAWNAEHQAAVEISAVVLACTQGWKDIIASHAGPKVRIEIVRNGIDPQYFTPRKVDRKQFGISPESFALGFFTARGSDSDAGRKGVDTLLAVLKKAAQEIPNLAVVVVGPGWEGLNDMLREAGATPHIFGFVPRSRIPLLYSLLDAYLLTSRVEGGPLTVVESMACGTPAVATRVGLVPEVIEDGVNGFSTGIGDVDALVAGLRALASDPDRHKRMRLAARATAEQHAAIRTHAPLRAILHELVRRPLRRELSPGPAWVNDAVGTSHVSCAAECIASIFKRIRLRRTRVRPALRLLRDMLEDSSTADRVRAVAMLGGIAYRVPNR